ncbi:MAG: hypothetical protein JNN03_11085 [Rubrivivax sp.]|nr:hypothetical protein [Rubrivivax sp.]
MRRRDVLAWAAALGFTGPRYLAAATAAPMAAATLEGWQLGFDAATGELHVRDREGVLRRRLPATTLGGGLHAGAAEVHALARRRGFVVAFDTLPELWEVSTDTEATPVFDGLVHDYRMGEGLGEPGWLAARRTRLPQPVHELGFDAERGLVACRARTPPRAGAVHLLFVQLDVRRVIKTITVDGDPDTANLSVRIDGARRMLHIERRDGGEPLEIDPWTV